MPRKVVVPTDELAELADPFEVERELPADEPGVEPDDEPGLDVEEEAELDVPLSLEEADPDEELWPGGPTVAETMAYKEEHGDVFVTTVTLEKHVMWKTLTRREYRAVVRRIEQLSADGEASPSELNMIQEELICELCLLHPKMSSDDFDGDLAGLPSLVSQQILESSGFVALDTRGL